MRLAEHVVRHVRHAERGAPWVVLTLAIVLFVVAAGLAVTSTVAIDAVCDWVPPDYEETVCSSGVAAGAALAEVGSWAAAVAASLCTGAYAARALRRRMDGELAGRLLPRQGQLDDLYVHRRITRPMLEQGRGSLAPFLQQAYAGRVELFAGRFCLAAGVALVVCGVGGAFDLKGPPYLCEGAACAWVGAYSVADYAGQALGMVAGIVLLVAYGPLRRSGTLGLEQARTEHEALWEDLLKAGHGGRP